MTILRIERLSPIETQKHCISNSLKYNASLHFLYRHVDIITLLSTFTIRHTLLEWQKTIVASTACVMTQAKSPTLSYRLCYNLPWVVTPKIELHTKQTIVKTEHFTT